MIDATDGPDDFDDQDDVARYVAEMHASMDASPEFVYVVSDAEDMTTVGVASTVANATRMANRHPRSTIIVPARIDDPEWGNREPQ